MPILPYSYSFPRYDEPRIEDLVVISYVSQ